MVRAEVLREQLNKLDEICCVCAHTLDMHIDEGSGWRCHALGSDGYQCECWLRKGRYESIRGYSLGTRVQQHLEELERSVTHFC